MSDKYFKSGKKNITIIYLLHAVWISLFINIKKNDIKVLKIINELDQYRDNSQYESYPHDKTLW